MFILLIIDYSYINSNCVSRWAFVSLAKCISVQHLHFNLILIEFSGRRTVAPPNTGSISLSLVRETSKFRKIFDKILFISNMANFWPGQVRGPNENGRYVNGTCSSKNRSGLNCCESSKNFEYRLVGKKEKNRK